MEGTVRRCPDVKEVGVTQIYVPSKQQDIIADIVFVHGLKGHPRRTWQYGALSSQDNASGFRNAPRRVWPFQKTKHSQQGTTAENEPDIGPGDACYWPFDLVPSDFENVRVLSYGYDSHPTHFYKSGTNQMSISQHGRQLLEKVANARSDCPSRPLIFVAHSLGGILVEDAIVESKKYTQQPRMQGIASNCVAIFFLGTPHLGANAAEWGLFFSNIVSTIPGGPSTYGEVLKGLSPDSEKLENLTRDFNDILDADIPMELKIRICSFQEGKGVTSATGFGGKVVSDKSSAFGRRAIENTSFINENHINMCRFKSQEDSGYEDFKANLTEYLEIAQQRSAKESSEPSFNRQVDEGLSTKRAVILQSLDFEGRCIRENQLWELETDNETFQWFWNPPSPFER